MFRVILYTYVFVFIDYYYIIHLKGRCRLCDLYTTQSVYKVSVRAYSFNYNTIM